MALAQTSAQPSSLTTGHTNHQDPLAVLDSIGKRVDPVYSQTLHIKVKELLHFSHSGFPGSQPVPFETKHLTILEREDYFVCEKSDGVRCLLLFTYSTKGPATFMLDRNQLWYYVPNVLFPVRGRDNEYLKDTLMDGEIVMDHGENGNKTYRFLIFDLMASNGMSIIQRSFNTRLGMLQQDVIQSYKHNLRTQSDPPPFTIELKKMERSYGLRLVFEQISKLRHNSDGIIWTPVKCPYVPGKCEKLLKWKPPEKNTVDFRINAKWSKDHKPIYTLDVLSHLTYKFFDHFQPDSDWALEWKDQPPDGRIAEFRYDPNWQVTIVEQGYAPTTRTGGWRFVRFRDDKDAANEESDVKKILHSIKDGVSKEQLFTHMECIRDAWKAREKGLPPPTLAHLKNRGRLSISNVSNSSSSNQPMMTPTAVSPVFPSPAANNLSSSSSHGYFYGDHSVKSRQNSMDSGSAERRYSMADATTDTKTETTPLDSNNSKDSDVALTQSLPVSRKQSLETSPKRDSNGNGMEETERKRHKSLSELDKIDNLCSHD
ncbi:mRNA capping enzyme, catalytic domain-containing protein [Chlamydoabsidia padenii]|nr:mRNA capping enzyme, catalytic domain-containing protein [Chlamydoabsidia padenii]